MKALILYRPNSEHARRVEEFVHEYTRIYPNLKIELLDLDGREGSALVSMYDITAYPAILALQNDGAANMVWQGAELPRTGEVASYCRS